MLNTVGQIEYDARINTSKLKGDASQADSIARTTGDNMGKSAEVGEKRASRAFGALVKTAKIASIAVGVAITTAIVSNVDNAIKRIDTLNNSTRTFENMGFKAKDTEKAMKALDQSIRGLPTPLDAAIRGMTLIAASTNDVGKSQKVFSALNNAVLGFGGTADMVSNAVVQLSQDLAGGKITAQTWLSLLNSGLGPALNAMARDMGITTKKLKAGLSDGSISVKQFQDSLIKLNEKGGGGMKSFEQIAKDSTAGIGSAWANMNTAIARSLANFISAIGTQNIAGAITGIGKAAESAVKFLISLGPALGRIATTVGAYLGPKLQALWTTLTTQLLPALNNLWKNVLQPLIPVIGTALVIGIGLAIDALNLLVQAITPVINFLAQNKDMVYAVVVALVAYKAALLIGGAAGAFMGSVRAMTATLGVYRTAGLGAAIKQTKIFQALVALPISMPAIAVAAALASIYLVYRAVQEVRGAIEAMNNANASADAYSRTLSTSTERLQQLRKNGTPAQKKRALKSLKAIAGNAKGTDDWRGGLTWVGEEGPELINLPKHSQVIPNGESEQIAKGGGGSTVVNISLSGIMSRSKSDERAIAESLIERINEKLRAKQLPQLGGGNI